MLLSQFYITIIILIATQLLNEASSIIISSTMLSTTSASTTNNVMMSKHRVELFFKNQSELIDRVRFLRDGYGISRFNLVNKNKAEPLSSWVQIIRNEYPESDISVHYSLKYNKASTGRGGGGGCQKKQQKQNQGVEAQHAARLTTFCNQVGLLSNSNDGTTTTNMKNATTANEILIVNGSGEKNQQWNTITALSHIATTTTTTTVINSPSSKMMNGGCCGIIIAVAYNPYFMDSTIQHVES